jgi:hypothetical protein
MKLIGSFHAISRECSFALENCLFVYILMSFIYLFICDFKKIVREASHEDNMGDLCQMEKNDDS